MKAKRVSVCLIALISVLTILVYPLLFDVRINDFSEKIVLGCGFAGEESLSLKQISKAAAENAGRNDCRHETSFLNYAKNA